MYTYKNNAGHDIVLPGIGVVQAGVTFKYFAKIENPNLTIVEASPEQSVIATEVPQAGTVVNASPVVATDETEGVIQ